MIKKPYSVTLVDARGLSQADKDEACGKFRAVLDAHFGSAEATNAAYNRYQKYWLAINAGLDISPRQRSAFLTTQQAISEAESAAYEVWVGDPGGAHFEVEVAI